MYRSNIKELIRQGNLATLEEVVLQGYGDRLLGETSNAPLVQDFLRNIPDYIDQITELHRASMKGNLREFQSLLDRKAIIIARDRIGATPLHKAVLYGHYDLADYIANNFPATIDARDNDGRTALHFAAALDDDRTFYNILVKAGSNPLLPDFKGKNAEFYLRFPDQINLQQILKRSQRLNANYAINTANRIKSKSPSRRKERSLSPSHRISMKRLSDSDAITVKSSADGMSEENLSDKADSSSNDGSHTSTNPPNFHRKIILPSPINPRIDVSSANLKRWIQENNLEMLEGVVLEGHGDRLKQKAEYLGNNSDGSDDTGGSNVEAQNYITETVPKIMNKIRIIHAAVSCGDLIGLQDNIEKKDYVLSKDHLGMAPLHKATILGHIDVVQYILEKFPEVINARDKDGRSALHYAAATTNRNGTKIYKMLMRAGADPRIRDVNGKTAEYYRVHLLSLPSELSRKNSKKKLNPIYLTDSQQSIKRRPILLPSIQEKISTALHDGDAKQLHELVLEGYGDSLFGRTSWGEEARRFLKGLPHLMDNIKSLNASIMNGDSASVQRILSNDQSLVRAKDENGLLPLHIATAYGKTDIVNYLITNYPQLIQLKDNSGRTALHISAQNKTIDIYRKLVDCGGDPKIMDQKGKTADYYLRAQTIQNYELVAPIKGSLDLRKMNGKNGLNGRLPSPPRDKAKPKIKPVAKPPANRQTVTTKFPAVIDDYAGITSSSDTNTTIESDTNSADNNNGSQALKKSSMPARLPSLFDKNNGADKSDNDSIIQTQSKSDINCDDNDNTKMKTQVEVANTGSSSDHIEILDSNDAVIESIENCGDNNKVETCDHNNNNKINENTEKIDESSSISEEVVVMSKETDKGEEILSEEFTPKTVEEEENYEFIENSVVENIDTDLEVPKDLEVEAKQETESRDVDINDDNVNEVPIIEEKAEELPLNNNELIVNEQNGDILTEVLPNQTNGDSNKVYETIKEEILFNQVMNDEIINDNNGALTEKRESLTEEQCDTYPEVLEENVSLLENSTKDEQIIEAKKDVQQEESNEVEQQLKTKEVEKQIETKEIEPIIETKAVEEQIEANEIEQQIDTQKEVEQQTETKEAVSEQMEKSEPTIARRLSKSLSQSSEIAETDQKRKMSRSISQQPVPIPSRRRSSTRSLTGSAKLISERQNSTDSAKALEKQLPNPSIKTDNELNNDSAEYNNAAEVLPVMPVADDSEANEVATKVINESFDAIKNSEIFVNEEQQHLGVLKKISEEESESALSTASQREEQSDDRALSSDQIAESLVTIAGDNREEVNNERSINNNAEQSVNEETRDETINDNIESDAAFVTSVTGFAEKTSSSFAKEKEAKETEETNEATAERDIEHNSKQENVELNQSENAPSVEHTINIGQQQESAEYNTGTEAEPPINDVKLDTNDNEMVAQQTSDDSNETQNTEIPSAVNENQVSVKDETTPELSDKIELTEQNDSSNSKQISEKRNEINNNVTESQTKSRSSTEQEARSFSRQSDGNISTHVDDRLNELIDRWLEEGDLLRLEHVVIAGQGERLIGKSSVNKQVQDFLELVPNYMNKIRAVHETVVRGNATEVKSILTRKRFALSRDQFGASPLHLAVLHAHLDVMIYIFTQFPETIDGPDNEGRTPVHYAAVMADPTYQYYRILENAGANVTIKDKSGHTPGYYLEHTGELTIRHLLERYKYTSENFNESSDVWQRPPTAVIESRLTPTPDESQTDSLSNQSMNKQEVDAEVHVDADERRSNLKKRGTFDRSVSQASYRTKDGSFTDEDDFETVSSEFQRSLKDEKVRLQKSFDRQMSTVDAVPMTGTVVDSIQDARPPIGSAIMNGENISGYDLTEIKDEYGRTILHLIAAKPQKRTQFYKILSETEYLIAERDSQYRTIRDVSVQNGIKDNLQVIDQFILDAFIKENVALIRVLSLEGYDNLLNCVDSEGHDVIILLKRHNVVSMINLVQDLAQFQKNRDELHTFIRHGYAEGVVNLTSADENLVIAKSERGRCALHIAILFANIDIIETLINANPRSVNTPDNMGRTPLHYAMASSRVEEIGRILIQSEANRALRDVRMRTPSYYFVYKQEIRDIKNEEQNLTI